MKKIAWIVLVFLTVQVLSPITVFALPWGAGRYPNLDRTGSAWSGTTFETQTRYAQQSYVEGTLNSGIQQATVGELGWQVGSTVTATMEIPTWSLITLGNGWDGSWIHWIASDVTTMQIPNYTQMYFGVAPSIDQNTYPGVFSISGITATSTSSDISLSTSSSINNFTLSIQVTVTRVNTSTATSYPITVNVNDLTMSGTAYSPEGGLYYPRVIPRNMFFNTSAEFTVPAAAPVTGAPVTVRYEDQEGNPVADSVIHNGFLGENWIAEEKLIDNYTLVDVVGSRTGSFTSQPQQVVFVYRNNQSNFYVETGTIDDWHKDDQLLLFTTQIYRKSGAPAYRIETSRWRDFSMADRRLVLKDTLGNVLSNNGRIADSVGGLIIWSSASFPESGDFTIEVYGKVSSELANSVNVNELDYFDFGPWELNLTTGNAFDVLVETAISEDPFLVKAGVLEVNHVTNSGEVLTQQTTHGRPGDSYETQAYEFEGYRLKEIIGDPTGEYVTQTTEVTYVYEEFSRLTIEGLRTEHWHKDNRIPIATLNFYLDNQGTRQIIRIPALTNHFTNFVISVTDETGTDVTNTFRILNGSIESFGITPRNAFYTIEISGLVTNSEQATLTSEEYFDFGELVGSVYALDDTGIESLLDERIHATRNPEAKASVLTVNHLSDSGEILSEPVISHGKPGDMYETQAKEFEGYRVKKIIGEAIGEHTTVAPIEVTYVYEDIPGILELLPVEQFDFGEVERTSREQTVFAKGNTAPTITIRDYSNFEGWSFYVSATPFVNQAQQELTGVTMMLQGLSVLSTVHSLLSPPKDRIELSASQSLITSMSSPGEEIGPENGDTVFQIGEADDGRLLGISLNLPANTTMDLGAYQSKITWELVADVTISGGMGK